MCTVKEYKRKPVMQVCEKVFLNGSPFRVTVINSDKPLSDTEVVEAALLATLNQFFYITAKDETKYTFARDFFNRLLEKNKEGKNEQRNCKDESKSF